MMSTYQIITFLGVLTLAMIENTTSACNEPIEGVYCLGTDGINDVSSEAGQGE